MIRDRPPLLLQNPLYRALPDADLSADVAALPKLLQLDLDTLSGVQPVTRDTAAAADGNLRDNLSPGEAELHRIRDARFQLIFIVLSLYALKARGDGGYVGRPYAISLIPASKRGAVSDTEVAWVEKMDLEASPFAGQAYLNFNPFSGERGMFGPAASFRQHGAIARVHPDEFGFVTGGYLLAPIADGDEPLLPDAGLKGEQANARYAKYRAKTYFKRFATPRTRRVWGLDSPIELFLAQGLAEHDLFPDFQTLFLPDGSVFPSYYHMLDDPQLRTRLDAITTADLYFPKQRLAVFCDGRSFHRGGRGRAKDDSITRKLSDLGVRVLRIPGSTINRNLPSAVDEVIASLS